MCMLHQAELSTTRDMRCAGSFGGGCRGVDKRRAGGLLLSQELRGRELRTNCENVSGSSQAILETSLSDHRCPSSLAVEFAGPLIRSMGGYAKAVLGVRLGFQA